MYETFRHEDNVMAAPPEVHLGAGAALGRGHAVEPLPVLRSRGETSRLLSVVVVVVVAVVFIKHKPVQSCPIPRRHVGPVFDDRKSRHRGIEKQRRHERLAAASRLSPW